MERKRGRPSSSIQLEIDLKKRRNDAQPPPAKDVRQDQIAHWGIWTDKQQRCKYPNCNGFTFKQCIKCGVSLYDTKNKNCF